LQKNYKNYSAFGLLRGALSHPTAATVTASLDKDLSVATADELRHKLAHLLPVV